MEGIGEQSAILLKLTMELTKRYAEETYQPRSPSYRTIWDMANFICPKFIGLDHEQLHMILFNNRMEMLDHSIVSDGVVNSTDAPCRFIAERAFQKKAAFVVLAHNHPSGIAKPSPEDIDLTEYIRSALEMLGILLLEHLVVVNFGFHPIIHNQYKIQGFPSPIQVVGQDKNDPIGKRYNDKDGIYQLDPIF